MKKLFTKKILLIAILLLPNLLVSAQTSDIVVTIKPLHSLVASVIGDSGRVALLLDGKVSVHNFQLKPSQVRLLQKAKVIFYIDDNLETFLMRLLKTSQAYKFAISEHKGIKILAKRSAGVWHKHHHHNHLHNNDMHLWLDPKNASLIVLFIADKLSAIYPQNRHIYQANAQKIVRKIDLLNKELQTKLTNVRQRPFVVFHDAYQYFERAYGLNSVGAIAFDPGKTQSAKNLQELRKQLINTDVKCVFSEPQFPLKLVKILNFNNNIKTATLDPLGADLDPGENLYFELINNLADSIRNCLI